MTYPAIPGGRAPTPSTVRSEMHKRDHQVAELTRRGPAPTLMSVCRVVLTVDVPLSGGTDTFAQGNWAAPTGEDPDGLAGLVSGYSTITVKNPGRYIGFIRGIFTSPSAASSMVAYITKGSPNINNSIVRDPRNSTTYGGDGTVCREGRPVFLNAGDVLYWGFWSYASCTLSHTNFGVPTEVSITQIGTR